MEPGPGVAKPLSGLFRTVGRPTLIVLLSLLGGMSSWLLIPFMQNASDGTATPAEGWVDGLIPLLVALIAIGYSTYCAAGSRAGAFFPLLPFALTTLVWALASGLESGSDAVFAFCLLGMPVLALGGGLFSARAVIRQNA